MNLIFISGKPQEGGTKGWNLNLVCSVRVVHKQCDAFLALLFGAPLWFSDRGRIKDRRMTRMNLPFVPSFSPSVLSCSDHACGIQESDGLETINSYFQGKELIR